MLGTSEILRRFLNPASVAIVGASDNSTQHSIPSLLASGLDVYLVNPRRDTVFGHRAYPDLASIGHPVDAVYSMVNAAASVAVVQEAASLGCGGVVVRAAGFAEMSAEGAAMQAIIADTARAAGIEVLGPNCNGFINVPGRAFVSGVPKLELREGGLGIVSHSGGMLTDVGNAGRARGIGFSALISTGNEAVTDLVDCVEYFIEDPQTKVIGLILESLRDADRFFVAADRALAAGKPIVALKLGRSSRGREVAKSHTGAVTGEPWVYDAVFRQHGVIAARDLTDFMERTSLFEQLPTDRRGAVSRLGVLTISGGAAASASDVAEEEGIELPEIASVADAVTAAVPHLRVFNPVDFTGFVHGKPEVFRSLVDAYVEAPEIDSLLLIWTVDPNSEAFSQSVTGPFAAAAASSAKPMLMTALDSSEIGEWAVDFARSGGVGLGRGLRATMRGIASMAEFDRARSSVRDDATAVAPLAQAAFETVATRDGRMLGFASAMDLLGRLGIPTSPYLIVGSGESAPDAGALPRADRYVVKLADVPHRSELGAVKVGVAADGIPAAVDDLREIARFHDVAATVVVQPMESIAGEVIVGFDRSSELGPLVVSGHGGILVELLGSLSARLAPIGAVEAGRMVSEFDQPGLLDGVRGQAPWDRDGLAKVIAAVSALASAAPWVQSLDINPLIWNGEGYRAADALVLVGSEN